jgi:iron complex outermembrane receptor protein
MFKRTKISTGTLLAISLIAASAAIAQGAPQRVEITGSNIKRIGNEGPLPVEVITRADIERKGVTSTNDLLRSLTYMSSYNDELISPAPPPPARPARASVA